MSNLLRATLASALVVSLSSFASHAAYLDFSGNWSAPATVGMSERAARSVVSQCKAVSAYSNMAGTNSGAMVVAGPHPTATDKKVHLTVRLYKNHHHDKSCHVYIGKNSSFTSCSCQYAD